MKKTTCRDLRDACDIEIVGETPEEMGSNSRLHVMEMVRQGDKDHMQAVEAMKKLTPEEQNAWYEDFKKRFELLPEA